MKYILIVFAVVLGVKHGSAQIWKDYSDSFMVCYEKELWPKAIQYAEQAHEAALNDIGSDHAAFGDIAHNLGTIYRITGMYEKALPLQIESMQNGKKFLSTNDPEYIIRIGELADLYQLMGEFNKARELYDEAYPLAKTHLGKEHTFYNSILIGMGMLKTAYGEFDLALLLYREALENTEKIYGKINDEYATVLNNLGGLYLKMGNYQMALEVFLEALETTEKTLGKEHPYYAMSLSELATLYQELGLNQRAAYLYEQALEIAGKTLSKEHSLYTTFSNNLAFVYEKLKMYDKAEVLYLEAREVAQNKLGKDHFLYGRSLNNLAHLYHAMGAYRKALPLLLESLEICKSTLGKEHSDYGMSLNNLAYVYQDMSQLDTAEILLKQALENAQKHLDKIHIDYIVRLKNLACLYHIVGRPGDQDLALQLALEAVKISQRNIQQLFTSLSEKEKAMHLKQQELFSDILLSLSLKQSNLSICNALFENQVINKGLIMSQSKQVLQFLRSEADSATVAIYYTWIDLRKKISRELFKSTDQRTDKLGDWQKKAEKLESQLSIASKDFGQLQNSLHFKMPELQKALGKHSAYVHISTFRYWNKEWTDTVQYVAFIALPQDTQARMLHLGNQFDFLSQGSAVPYQLYEKTRGIRIFKTGKTIDEARISKALYRLKGELKGIDTLYFSLSGLFNQINAPATVLPNRSRLWDHFHIELNTTVQTLLYPAPSARPTDAILFGALDYNSVPTEGMASLIELPNEPITTSTEHPSIEPWEFLGATQNEVDSIAILSQLAGLSTQKTTGSEGTETAFKSLDRQPPGIVHMATHGFFFNEEKEAVLPGTLGAPYRLSKDPMMRAGLVLAGANATWAKGFNPTLAEDGILTAMEISQMDLSQTQLVVLSACKTGLGDIDNSQGVYGLQRAFKMAGVDHLIISLWNVPDQETSELMIAFYRNWLEKEMSLSEAFYTAQKAMAAEYPKQPELWAGFVLMQ